MTLLPRIKFALAALALIAMVYAMFWVEHLKAKRLSKELAQAEQSMVTSQAQTDLGTAAQQITDRRLVTETRIITRAEEAASALQAVPDDRLVPQYLDTLRGLRNEAGKPQLDQGPGL